MRRESRTLLRRTSPLSVLAAALLVSFLAGCAARSRPPATPPDGMAFGQASWYGIEERGRPTANGERMDPGGMTAAHRTLPFGTIIAVTDLDTGRVVEVRINDRGPFIAGRIIDLSHEAARQLGIVQRGVARVMLTVVELASEPPFTVQVGAFRGLTAADQMSQELRAQGYSGVVVSRAGGVHRVRVGRFRARRDAEGLARTLSREGYETLVLRIRL